MRQGTNNRRSRGRTGRKQPSGRFQTFDSNGPNGRLRGNAHQLYEKYLTLGRDAAGSGDRITAENLFQHAEHYFRIVNANGGDGTQRPRMNGDGEQPEIAAAAAQSGGDHVPSAEVSAGEEPRADTAEPVEPAAAQPAAKEPAANEPPAETEAAAAPAKGNGKGNGRQRRRKATEETDAEPADGDQTLVS